MHESETQSGGHTSARKRKARRRRTRQHPNRELSSRAHFDGTNRAGFETPPTSSNSRVRQESQACVPSRAVAGLEFGESEKRTISHNSSGCGQRSPVHIRRVIVQVARTTRS